MDNKICPIMSKVYQFKDLIDIYKIGCLKEQCQFWKTGYDAFGKPCSDCVYVLQACSSLRVILDEDEDGENNENHS